MKELRNLEIEKTIIFIRENSCIRGNKMQKKFRK
jgi:hypothetical protein